MTPGSKRDMLRAVHPRYQKANREAKSRILDEFCATTRYHRKYAIHLLNRPVEEVCELRPRRRGHTYSIEVVGVLARIWEAAGYPWSVRLKAMIPLWLPWARNHIKGLTAEIERQLLKMSPRQMDRRLRQRKKVLGRRIYGRTKPGTLLKHHIPIKTHCWDVKTAGFAEIDLVSHSGNNASGQLVYSLNLTDIDTTWVETAAVIGKGQKGVVGALADIQSSLPFPLRGVDSDNGSEFLNHHLYTYCQEQGVQFTRSRPYKKDDNAHIEQKNWTHVRKLLGWDRYDSHTALEAINGLYRNELRLMMNLFKPSVELMRKTRVGSRLRRHYDQPQTPLDRLRASKVGKSKKAAALTGMRNKIDPFELSRSIARKLKLIYELAKYSR